MLSLLPSHVNSDCKFNDKKMPSWLREYKKALEEADDKERERQEYELGLDAHEVLQ